LGLVGGDPDGRLRVGSGAPAADWVPTASVTGTAASITLSADGTIAIADERRVRITRDAGAPWVTVIYAA